MLRPKINFHTINQVRFLSTRDIAKSLTVSTRTVRRWIQHGWLPGIKLSRKIILVPETGFIRFLKDRGIEEVFEILQEGENV
jgi:excisionase family DNA binding protein